jgi:hypothetical protein
MRTRGIQGSLPKDMPIRELTYRWFAKTYRWTPKEVDELPLDTLNWFPIIEEAENKVVERMNKESSRQSSGGPTRRVLGR